MFNDNPKTVYTFLLYLISKDYYEAEWHFRCYLYLVYYNPFFDDTMCLAAWHIKHALALDPQNIEYKAQVISTLYSYPEYYFTEEEFKKYATDILANEPDNENAKEIICKINS